MDRISTGLVGCGGMGRRHLRAYAALRGVGLDRFEVVAVCDPRREAAQEAADLAEELLGTRPAIYTDFRSWSAPDRWLLDVVTEPSVHHLIVPPALTAGLHVICEKPLGLTVRACREMVNGG